MLIPGNKLQYENNSAPDFTSSMPTPLHPIYLSYNDNVGYEVQKSLLNWIQ